MTPTKKEMLAALKERIGGELLERFQSSAAAICGLGGLGSNIAVSLVRAGVGSLFLYDFDDVDVTNLGLDQTLFVRDLQLGEKQTVVTRGELAVAVVKAPDDAPAAGAPAADAAKSPDVIKKGKEEAAGAADKKEEKK